MIYILKYRIGLTSRWLKTTKYFTEVIITTSQYISITCNLVLQETIFKCVSGVSPGVSYVSGVSPGVSVLVQVSVVVTLVSVMLVQMSVWLQWFILFIDLSTLSVLYSGLCAQMLNTQQQ